MTNPLAAMSVALEHLVASPDPVEVFTALTEICTATWCETCEASIVIEPSAEPDAASSTSATVLRVPIRAPATGPDPGFHGVLTCGWRDGRQPADEDVAIGHMAVARAVTVVQEARLTAALASAQDKVENLTVALESSRQIGAAMGILMSRHLIPGEAAFDLLRVASQHSHRKLRDIAAEVVSIGDLPTPASPAVGRSAAGAPARARPERTAADVHGPTAAPALN